MAVKQAKSDINRLAKRIAKDLGVKSDVANTKANISNLIGGNIFFHIPLEREKELFLSAKFNAGFYIEQNRDFRGVESLNLDSVIVRVESSKELGANKYGKTYKYNKDVSYIQLINDIKNITKEYVKAYQYDLFFSPVEDNNIVTEIKPDIISNIQARIEIEEDKQIDQNNKQEENNNINNNDYGSNTIKSMEGRVQSSSTEMDTEVRGQTDRGLDKGRMDSSNDGLYELDQNGSRGLSATPTTETIEPIIITEKKNQDNYRFTGNREDFPASASERYKDNIEAIKLLHTLDSENRQATTEEQDILSKYSGWGGLGTYFDKNDSPWNKNALNRILTAEEYQSAELSRNSAYYTPDYVCDALWNIASSLGFKGGNILEGSAGTGKILSRIPEDINANSDIQAVEIDDITGRILTNLYPNANVNIQGFQATRIENNSVDLAITNVPFVHDLHVKDNIDRDLSDKFKDVGTFCLAKNIRKLKEGGLGIFITTSSTLDNNRAFRNWVITEADSDFLGAFRLHSKTFNGTLVTSDILVVRKRINGIKSEQAIDVLNSSVVREVEIEIEKGNDKTEIITRNLDYNSYFVENPDKMGGLMMFAGEYKENTYRPTSKHLYPAQDINQKELLLQWSKSFKEELIQKTVEKKEVKEINTIYYEKTLVKEGALLLNSNNEICISRGGEAIILGIDAKKVKGRSKAEVLTDYLAIKSSLDDCIIFQQNNTNDEELKPFITKLNEAYDNFVYKYGQLNENRSISFLKNDVDFPTITAIELYSVEETEGKQKIHTEKTNVFKERVIGVIQKPIIKDIKDGVIWSYQQFGKIDLDAISNVLKISNVEVKDYLLENGFAFINPIDNKLQIRHEYLSGNVREKLYYALENNSNGEYDNNIKELSKVIPMNIPAHSIEFTLGSTWLDSSLYEEFAKQTYDVELKLVNINSYWHWADDRHKYLYINERNKSKGVFSTLLDEHIPGHELFLAAINNKQYRVSKVDYSTKELRVDKEATKTCQDRIDEIKEEFKEWARQKMLDDPKLAEKIEKVYNDKFNSIVPIKIDKQFLQPYLNGMSRINPLYQHQQEAIVRCTMKPTMLAHEVGTGKTYTLIASAMEMKRLGMAKKPMIVVQNSTTGQFVSQAKTLYPGARILTVTDTDRTPEGRQSFYAKIKYNDWDLIIIPQSVFDMIPDSDERIRSFIQDKIDETKYALSQARESDIDKRRIKEMENQIQAYEQGYSDANLSVISSPKKKKTDGKKEAVQRENAIVKAEGMVERKIDNTDSFDEMGIDALLIDEAHNYKHLGFSTTMTRGIKGIDPSYSKRAVSLYLKIQSIYERVGYKNVVMATGTPISNTAGEIWTFMRYLMPKEELQKNHIYYFDDFVHNFGNISQSLEFATNGKYKLTTRFASYINMPELMRMWCSVSDTVLSKDAEYVNKKIPKTENGYYNEQNIWVNQPQDIFLSQSDSLIRITDSVKKELLRYEEMSPRERRENTHIPLTMFGIAQKAALDVRLVDKYAPDEECSKTNYAVKDILKSIDETNEYKGTVAVFCDIYRRYDIGGNGERIEGFNLFEDIKDKLISSGKLRDDEIVVLKSTMSQKTKEKIFQKVNDGDIRVIFGTSENLGTGVNIQKRLHTLIHIDAPARPMDYTQRNGRILRQGNLHKDWDKPVRILRYGVEDSLDITRYSRLQIKENFINEVMDNEIYLKNNQINRIVEETEEGQFDNPVAQLSGSQFALKKQQAERIYKKLKSRETNYKNDQVYIESQLRKNTSIILSRKESIETNTKILNLTNELFPNGNVNRLIINGVECFSQKDIENAFTEINKETNAIYEDFKKNYYNNKTQYYTMELNNTKVNIKYDYVSSKYFSKGITLTDYSRNISYEIPDLGYQAPVQGQWIKRVYDDILADVITGKHFKERIEYAQRAIDRLENENSIMLERRGKPFEFSAELTQAKLDVEEYNNLMKEELEEKAKKYEAKLKDNEDNSEVVNLQEMIDNEIETEEQLYTESNYEEYDESVILSATDRVLNMLLERGIDVRIISELEDNNILEQIKTTSSTICGFTAGNTIYLTHDGINPETPIHEYTHLWCKVMEIIQPMEWSEIVSKLKGTPVWNEVLADEKYSKIHSNDNRMASEVLARISGRRGAQKFIKYAKDAINEPNEKHRGIKATLVNNMKKAVQKFWTIVKNSIFRKEKYSNDIADTIINDLITGKTVNKDTLNIIKNGTKSRFKQSNDESNSDNSTGIHRYSSANRRQKISSESGIGMFTVGLSDELWRDSEAKQANVQRRESERLIEIAKENNIFFSLNECKNFGEKVNERSGESIVYFNESSQKYIKLKDPYAKAPIKNICAYDAIFEHIIHNLITPNTEYTFKGITEDIEGVRIILEQKAIDPNRIKVSQEEVHKFLEEELGLKKEDNYFYGNDYYAITDINPNESDNVMRGNDGNIYFIDPLIRLKKPAPEVIEYLLEARQKQNVSIDDIEFQYYNNKFNEELEKQINGTLPNNHIYELGMPSNILLSTGIPNLPIELASSRLYDKGMQANHPFDISEIKNLVNAIQEPMAVFRSATHLGSFVILTEIEHEGKNFVVALQTNKSKGKIVINDIRSIYPKNNRAVAQWIYDDLAEYINKEKMSEFVSKPQSNSVEVRNLFRHSTKIIQNFENPILEEEKNEIFNKIDDIEFQFKQDYCNNFKQLDFKELKSKIKISEFAEYLGYKLRKDKTTHKHLVYEHNSGEKICIYNNPEGKPQIYMTLGGTHSDKGDIISFVMNKIDNGIINKPTNSSSTFESVNILLHEYLNIPFEDRKVYNGIDEYIKNSKQNRFISDYQPYIGNITSKAVEYMSSRGLETKDYLLYPFRGSVVGTNTAKIEADINKIPNNQVAFPLYDKNEKMVGVQLVSENYKSFLKGSRKSVGVWHSNIPERINNIVISEAPLDAISYHKLQGDSNTLYFATCGNVKDGQLDAIKTIIENNKNILAANYTITLANDNDTAGAMFNLGYILSNLEEKGYSNIHFNNTKDDRSDLVLSLNPSDTNKLLELYNCLPKDNINIEIKTKERGVNIIYSRDIKTVSALNDLLLKFKPQNIKIDVPITKDYNEDLKTLQHINALSSDKYTYQDVKHNSFLFTDDITKYNKEKKKHRGIRF